MNYELIKIRRRFKYFDLREEMVTDDDFPDMTMLIYRTKTGDYIDARFQRRSFRVNFIANNEIRAEKASEDHSVCSIGKSDQDGKWYGWSHRAMVGFGVGDKIFEEAFGDDYTPYREHGSRPIRNNVHARAAAVAFAASVS